MGTFNYVHALNSIKVSEEDKKQAEQILIDAMATTYGSEHNVDNILDDVLQEILGDINAKRMEEENKTCMNFDYLTETEEDRAAINKFDSFKVEYKDRLVNWYQYSLSRLPLFRYTKTIEDVNKQLHDMVALMYKHNKEKVEEQAEKVE